MGEWKSDKDVEKVKVTIEIPKDTVAFIVNHLVVKGSNISMVNSQYDSSDVEKLIKDSEKVGD